MFKKTLIAATVAACTSFVGFGASAATKDVDLLFIIDSSGSMGAEFTTLANNIESFFNLLTSASQRNLI
ncbi:hypothetical protein G5B39_02660 [Rhodobacteraceae bacterium SC52]|nr:hypothetical protein G5B39_02660 [Rhodobacteraceae bacterium SC52]